MGSLSLVHWLIVAAVILLLFGPSKVANLGKELGKGIREFKSAVNEDKGDDGAKKG